MKALVLGLGSIGRRHVRNLYNLGVSDIHAFDPAVTETDLPVTLAMESALESLRPDLVIVASPSHLHGRQLRFALDRFPAAVVLVEKPLVTTREDLRALADLPAGARVITGCNMRFHAGPAEVRRRVTAGDIGELLH